MPSPYSSFEPGRVLSALREATADPKPALEAIGAVLESRAKTAFVEQKRGKEKWAPRVVPNIAGIVSDLRQGKTPPARRFEPRPAGIDSGRLLADISSRVTSTDTVEIGSRLPHASLIQYGGSSKQPWPQSGKDALRRLLKTEPFKTYEDRLWWLLGEEITEVETNVRARPFLGIDGDDRAAIFGIVKATFAGQLGSVSLTYGGKTLAQSLAPKTGA